MERYYTKDITVDMVLSSHVLGWKYRSEELQPYSMITASFVTLFICLCLRYVFGIYNPVLYICLWFINSLIIFPLYFMLWRFIEEFRLKRLWKKVEKERSRLSHYDPFQYMNYDLFGKGCD